MNKTNKWGKKQKQKDKIKHMQAMQPCKNYLEGDLGKLR